MNDQARLDKIQALTQELIDLGAELICCGAFQKYELRARYGAPELETKRPAYLVLMLPDDAIDMNGIPARRP